MTTYPLAPESSTPPALAPKPRPQKPALAKPTPLWPTPEEETGRRWMATMVFIAFIALYSYALSFYYTGAHPGVDQNGYLMTARLIAGDKNFYAPDAPAPYTGPIFFYTTNGDFAKPPLADDSPAFDPTWAKPAPIQETSAFNWLRNRLSFIPETPYQFAGRMDIITEPFGPPSANQPAEYRIYAKYPFGFPLLAAIARLLGGIDAMYLVNPICTILACYFAYFLFRQAVSPFMSLLGVIWLACNPLVLYFSNDANSHASTLLCVTVGFWGLLSWLRTQQNWRAWIGGFALGYACCIRYSEFLLLLPVAFAALINFRFNWKKVWGSFSLLLAWAIPVAVLAFVCYVCFGEPWKTGYTYCKESTGFAWKYLTGDFGDPALLRQGNWETLLTQLNHTGLFLLWPLALAGLLTMLGSAWRLAFLLILWVLPSTLLYMLYYWAPTGDATVGYLRFFMSIIPGLIFAGVWLLDRALTVFKGDYRVSLLAITTFGFSLLICAALYFENETLPISFAIFPHVGTALWHFVHESWIGLAATLFVLALIAGIWIVDREHASDRVGFALAAGVLTAVGCGMNLYSIAPQIDNTRTFFLSLRQTVNILHEKVPTGSLVFADPRINNQLDAIGSWRLVDDSLFSPAAFNESRVRIERRDRDKDTFDDPDPIQLDRSRFYLELLGKINPEGNWSPRAPREFLQEKMNIADKNFDENRRVFLVNQENLTPGKHPSPPAILPGYKVTLVTMCGTLTPDYAGPLQPLGRRRALGAPPPTPAPPARTPVINVWEITKAPLPAKPAARQPATRKPR